MFAVPGWKVPAKSLVQEKAQGNSGTKAGAQSKVGLSRDTLSKKRKRKRDSKDEGSAPNRSSSHKGQKSGHQRDGSNRRSEPARPRDNKRGHNNRKGDPKVQSSGANSEPVGMMRKSAHNEVNDNSTASPEVPPSLALMPPIPPISSKLTPLQAKMRAKLTSARFRHLNETLYTTSSADALQLFTNSPDLFTEYHAGFSQQVKDSWPENPVDVYVDLITQRAPLSAPAKGHLPLPRRRPGTCSIADLGCGDAPLARGVQSVARKFDVKIHSFDLQTPNELITKADISALPLHDGQVDVAIFCLSLMGTNWLTFIEEAWRVMRGDGKGELWVAEVKSRFGRLSAKKGPGKVVENSVGKRRKVPTGQEEQPNFVEDERDADKPGADDDTDLQPFIDSIQKRGFMLRDGSIDKSNKMFVSMVFTKVGPPRAGKWKGMKWNGKEYEKMEEKKKRFQSGANSRFATVEEEDGKDEGKLLKPCVYKLR